MCGIAGVYSAVRNESDPVRIERINRALMRMHHRGPDYQRTIGSDRVILGHARLSIIDPGSGSNQPMCDASGRWFLSFNGEIFNYPELRKQLQAKGIQFTTAGDTEVLLHLLIQKGLNGLNELNGFFAFAFWDVQNSELWLVRDRFGEKPLWYSTQGDDTYFASEGKALDELCQASSPDPVAIASYLRLTYLPGTQCATTGYHKIPPGHLAIVSARGLEIKKWYRALMPEIRVGREKEQLEALLISAVRRRLISDVPLGAFLSGGLDSSIVSALAIREKPDIKTFSIAFPDHPYLDESADAQLVANHIGSNHQSILLTDAELFQSMNRSTRSLDEPFADSSAIAVNALAEMVKKEVTVALSGDGADELFGGYRKHIALMEALNMGEVKKSAIKITAALTAGFSQSRQHRISDQIRKLQRMAEGLSYTPSGRYLFLSSFARQIHLQAILPEAILNESEFRIMEDFSDLALDETNGFLEADQRMVLAGDMLVKVDLMSMAHSLEVRSPFMDYTVVEYARALPPEQKIRQKTGKYLLRETFGHLLPSSTLKKRKQGFEIPLESWLANELRDELRSLESSRYLRELGCIDTVQTGRIVKTFLDGKEPAAAQLLYSLLVLNRWLGRT